MNAKDLPDAAMTAADGLETWLGADGSPWRLAFDHWPQAEAHRWRAVLAVSTTAGHALLADRALDTMLRQRLEARLQRRVRWVACEASAVDAWLGAGEQDFRATSLIEDGFEHVIDSDSTVELNALHLAEQTSPVVRLLDSTLYDALKDGVSDIHFECVARGLVIRYRIDGVMLHVRSIDGAAVAEQLVSRLKVMAELDIGERRLPQDGRFKLRSHGREIDFRLSVMPSVFGEDAVIRVLDRAQVEHGAGQLTLDSLGFDAATRQAIRAMASRPHGMLLVTGPTGSGKTTTLYAAINEVNTGHDKIVTIEDPVEYQLPGVVQIPVNEKKGLTFARGLRSVLRHDPDRVMVGEIRDPETAQIAVQAALTGHLVFSTVHANNALDVIGRFMHMGLDLYNVVSALNGVLAQRLLRLNCRACVQPDPLGDAALAALQSVLEQPGEGRHPALQPMRGRGCLLCRGTGYKGRMALAELLPMSDELRDLIASRAPMSRIKEVARNRGMRPLRDLALLRACRGETTLEEVDRVTSAD